MRPFPIKMPFTGTRLVPSIKRQLAINDERDKKLESERTMKDVEHAFPYIKGDLLQDDCLLEELNYIRIMFSKPLSPGRKIRVRRIKVHRQPRVVAR